METKYKAVLIALAWILIFIVFMWGGTKLDPEQALGACAIATVLISLFL